MMAFIPPWAWRWLAVAGIGASLYGVGWLNGRHHEERLFDDYKEQVKLAADKQAFLTQQTIKAHQALKEISDAESKTLAAERDAATLRVRQLVQAGRDRSLLPPLASGTASNSRICYADRDQLDRGIREGFNRLSERIIKLAQQGQRGADVATVCRDWSTRLAKGTP